MAQVANQSSAETIAQFDRYVIPNYRRYPVCLVRGEGSWVWDAEGNRYLDFFPGWGCNLLGHCPPRVVEAVREQVGQLIHVPNTWYMEAAGGVRRRRLSERSFGGQCFFCNSGAEANEAAIKLARAYGHAAGRFKIVTMEGGLPRPDLRRAHGDGPAQVSRRASSRWSRASPTFPTTTSTPSPRVLDDQTAAVLVEPIQGEGGINIPSPGYLRRPAPALRRAGRAPDPRRGPDRHGPHRRVVRLPALRRRARHPDLRQGPGRRDRGGRDDGHGRASPRRSSRGCTPAPSAATRSPAAPGWRRSRRSRRTACSSAAGRSASGSAATSRRSAPELPDLIRDIRVLGDDDRPRPDGRRLGGRRRVPRAAAPDQRHARPRRPAPAGA